MALADHDMFESPRIATRSCPVPGMRQEDWLQFFGPTPTHIGHLDGDAYNEHHHWWLGTFSPKALAHWADTLIEPIANAAFVAG